MQRLHDCIDHADSRCPMASLFGGRSTTTSLSLRLHFLRCSCIKWNDDWIDATGTLESSECLRDSVPGVIRNDFL
jgi:hypothetical protein